jgi:predicted dehydrogenase
MLTAKKGSLKLPQSVISSSEGMTEKLRNYRMTKKIRLLILGTGGMAKAHAGNFATDPRVEIVACSDVMPGRAEEFAKTHGIAKFFTNLEDAITWGEFDAATNVTPDSIHHPTTMKLLAANKHVLCEKPLAENFALANEMATAAEKAGLINMVNLTYRNDAALHAAKKLVDTGNLGDIRHVEAIYRQSWLVGDHWGHWSDSPTWLWRLSEKHGSKGVLGDVGIHILDYATFAAGALPSSIQSWLKTFDKAPQSDNKIGEYVLDANDSCVITSELANGALCTISASRFMTGYDNVLELKIFGTKGAVEVTHREGWNEVRACLGENIHTMAWQQIKPEPVRTNYQKFIDAIAAGQNSEPDFRRAATLQKVLDEAYTNG